MSYDLDRAVKQLQTTVTRLDLKQARVRRVGSSTIVFDGTPFAEPDQANGDTAGGSATVAQPPIPDPQIVQSAWARSAGGFPTVVLPTAPIEGNTLILWQVARETNVPTAPSGWSAHPSGVAQASSGTYNGAFFYKVVTAGQSATIVCNTDQSIAFIVEVEGIGSLDVSSETNLQNGDAVSVSLIPTGPVFMIGGLVIRSTDGGGETVAPDGNSTELFDQYTGVGSSPVGWAGYRVIDPAGGAFSVGGTFSQGGRDWGGQALAFDAGSGTGWVSGPFVNDGDDATCEFVPDTETEVARIVLSPARAIARARLNIKIETAGAVTYDLQAATLADFSDAVTVASATFTALGSFTAQDVEFDWTSTGSFRYWQLVGPAENRYICTLELYETVVTGITDHGALSGLDDDDHSAYLTNTGGGRDVIQAHGVLGATEIVDLANGNVHTGTLDQNATISTTGWTNLRGCMIRLAVTEGGAGDFLLTVDDVTWVGAAPTATAAGTVIHIVLFSDDGGTTKWGSVLGAGTVSDLDDLTDVTITTPAEDDDLRYNGSLWVNDARKWEAVTDGEDVFVWETDDLVHEWSTP